MNHEGASQKGTMAPEEKIVLVVTLKEYDTIRGALHYFGHPASGSMSHALELASAHSGPGEYLSDCNATREYSNFEAKIEGQFNEQHQKIVQRQLEGQVGQPRQAVADNREIGVGAQVGTEPEPVNC